ncbi:hypothetical protein [Chryseobacterium sp. BIGb0232]|uniref:hypothetical protein n=1 Tax=Chryseobacterium sp. BIGb0232 TaxID=2940598 RepID=UPI000F474069|nr:hypothetical protein [Chryseobacterium sp. BIGb0232]MCS4301386.1 hypothetical protein [Chryseobacterium sp. BIGb0232]ROS19756.1 hypothetical protein EDF65_0449 [Chryseobacterium nakagawai]
MSEFNILIDRLDFWLVSYSTSKTKTIDEQLFNIAKSITDWVAANGWPSDFNNNDAKNLIQELSNRKDPAKRGEEIRVKIKTRVIKEEPTEEIAQRGLSQYVWVDIGEDGFKKTPNLRFTDAEINNMIKFGLERENLPDAWIEGIITKAFRVPKAQTIAETEMYLTNASNLLKPTSLQNGRGGLLYCFKDENQKLILQDKLKKYYIEKYGLTNYISESQKLVNTFYGGSVHTKIVPPDVDTVTYLSDYQMLALFAFALDNLKNAKDKGAIDFEEYKKLRNGALKNMTGDADNKRVTINSFVLPEFIRSADPSNNIPRDIYKLHRMKDEIFQSSMNVNGDNIFRVLNLDPGSSLGKRLDFTFFTKTAAKNGRSIPPETQIEF